LGGQGGEPGEAGDEAGALEQSRRTDEPGAWLKPAEDSAVKAATKTDPAAWPQRSSPRVRAAGWPAVLAVVTVEA